MRIIHLIFTVSAGAVVLAACGGEHSGSNMASMANAAPAGGVSSDMTGPQMPDPGRTVIEVDMITDGDGSYFKPDKFEARRGDVIRFTLGQGVHNASFPADSNPGKQGLPPMGPMLQLPGQTYDVKVAWEPGVYFFQCDPHAALGMVGHVTVIE